MKQLMPKLTERLKDFKWRAATMHVPLFKCEVPEPKDDTISQAWFWPRLASFFKGNDVIVTETGRRHSQPELSAFDVSQGTANFGILDIPLPKGSLLLNQILWGSIGWSVGEHLFHEDFTNFLDNHSGSTLGAAMAARERRHRRTILFVGDGSL